jgi:dinuclear metal center YbgI/SA1388 family protein
MTDPSSPARVRDVLQAMEQWAPAWTAESWDRVGLFTGQPGGPAARIWTALELSPELVNQALAAGVQMLCLHHPPIFEPLADLRDDRPRQRLLVRAASAGLALFAAHTNLDSAPGGVNDALCARLGVVEARPLKAAGEDGLLKLVTFVPAGHLEEVARALFAAGAGRIGDYAECAFHAPGTGRFRAPEHGRPFIGRPGRAERADEERLETVLAADHRRRVVAALAAAHPYEEPAYDLYPLRQGPPGSGLGRVGRLKTPLAGGEFLARAARELGSPAAVAAGPLPEAVERVAVVGGSGAELLPLAAAGGAQVLVTGEARHHAWEEAADLGVCLAVMGHWATENVVVEPWARRLEEMLRAAGLFAETAPWTGADPWRPVQRHKEV